MKGFHSFFHRAIIDGITQRMSKGCDVGELHPQGDSLRFLNASSNTKASKKADNGPRECWTRRIKERRAQAENTKDHCL